jgi:hypothetical protein
MVTFAQTILDSASLAMLAFHCGRLASRQPSFTGHFSKSLIFMRVGTNTRAGTRARREGGAGTQTAAWVQGAPDLLALNLLANLRSETAENYLCVCSVTAKKPWNFWASRSLSE